MAVMYKSAAGINRLCMFYCLLMLLGYIVSGNANSVYRENSGIKPPHQFSEDRKGDESSLLQLSDLPLSSELLEMTRANEAADILSLPSSTDIPNHYYTSASELIPDQYKIVVVFDVTHYRLNDSSIKKLKKAVSKQLFLSGENIGINKVKCKLGIVELYVVYPVMDGLKGKPKPESISVLLPADQVLKQISLSILQQDLKPVPILSINVKPHEEKFLFHSTTKEITIWRIFRDRIWSSWQFPIIISSSLFAIFAMIILLMFVCYRWEARQKELSAIEEARRIVYQPVLKPVVKDADSVQPESRDSFFTETESEQTISPCRSPLHIRAKGLLERRGSNASLTLDLNRSPDSAHCNGSPKGSSAKEILMSAGNRMTRKQLRNCLRNVKALHTEFWEIPMNHPEKTEIPGSGTKNRYKTILPNEHSRVKLPEIDNDPLSAYINANYVRGYDAEAKAYIATQGPMAHTIIDFWEMIWQERTPSIVMITKLKEKNKVKCEPYIPDYHSCFGNIEVTVMKVIPRDGYTIRELFLKKGEEARQVLHFWYTTWPDHKTPATAKQLLAMALEVEAMRQDNNGLVKGPVVVHCSAGIGRTGCFIATTIGIQQLLEENGVDVLGIVCALRVDRGGMVQTAEQYEFVHQALNLFEQTLPDHSGD